MNYTAKKRDKNAKKTVILLQKGGKKNAKVLLPLMSYTWGRKCVFSLDISPEIYTYEFYELHNVYLYTHVYI